MAEPTAPQALRRPHSITAHGRTRVDEWYWLGNRDDPEVIKYLQAENAYADEMLAHTGVLQQELFEEIRGRVQETDAGPPARAGDWWYYSRTVEGQQYPLMCRRPDPERRLTARQVATDARAGTPPDEQLILDENLLAGGDYLAVGVFDVSPDHRLLAYGVDLDGSEEYTLKFRDLQTGVDRDDIIEGVYYGSAWGRDNQTFFYVRPDHAMRPWQVWCHILGADPATDQLLYQEDDERFFLSVDLSRSQARVVVSIDSKTSSEVRWLDASAPVGPDTRPSVLIERQPDVEYHAEHTGDSWLILTNGSASGESRATNFELRQLLPDGSVKTIVAHRPDVKLEGVDAFAGFWVVSERSATDGLERLRVLASGTDQVIDQPEAAYTLIGGQNPDWDQPSYRFGYTSLVTPRTSVDYELGDGSREEVWAQLVPGYDRSRFRTERLWATASDGTRVPISLVVRTDVEQDGTAPGLLYGYGSYEASMDPTFSTINLNLVER